MKKFWASKTFWLNLSTLPASAILSQFVDTELSLKISISINAIANLILRLFFTDTEVVM